MKPDIRDRIARHDKMNAERDRNETIRMSRTIEHMKFQEELEQWKHDMAFDMALLADRILSRLEQIRDENRPKSYIEGWDDDFCIAVRWIPEARAFVEKCETECIEVKKEYISNHG